MLSGEFVTKSIHTKKAHPNKAATRPRQRNNSPQAKKAKSARLSGCRQAKAGKFSSKTLHADPYQDEKSVAASCGFRPWNKRVSLDCRDRPPDCPNRLLIHHFAVLLLPREKAFEMFSPILHFVLCILHLYYFSVLFSQKRMEFPRKNFKNLFTSRKKYVMILGGKK